MYEKLINIHNSALWKALTRFQNAILIFCAIMITLTIFMTVIMRYIFHTDLYGVEEVILLIAFWLYFIGGAKGSMEDSHIKADILDVIIKSNRLKFALKSLAKIIEFAVLSVFTKMSLDMVILNFKRMPRTPGLKIPYVATQISIVLGFFLMTLFALYYLLLFFYKFKNSVAKGAEQ